MTQMKLKIGLFGVISRNSIDIHLAHIIRIVIDQIIGGGEICCAGDDIGCQRGVPYGTPRQARQSNTQGRLRARIDA